ncbi:MAG: hypothetical protein ACTJGT_07330 [Microbacteriaceae bacterium]
MRHPDANAAEPMSAEPAEADPARAAHARAEHARAEHAAASATLPLGAATMPASHELAAELEAAVREAAGVAAVYDVGGVLQKAVAAGARALSNEPAQAAPRVVVEHGDDGLHVDVAVGADAHPEATGNAGAFPESGAVAATRNAAAAVTAYCAERGLPVASVRVTVARVGAVAASRKARG